ncbi:MAG: chromate transporter [Acholeplasmataceae bacterium]|nr:MAG: chromate transporter [Acholeplasmataceae bacterium]
MWLELLTLFWIFFKIGLFTFGGGYAMIPLIKDEVVGRGYLDYDLMVDFIAISESTPGPIAVNMATFVGMSQYGLLGAVFTTFGVVLPSFIIISLVARFGTRMLDSEGFKHAFLGLRPVVIALILSVSVTLMTRTFLPNIRFAERLFDTSVFDWRGVAVILLVGGTAFFYRKLSPIQLIVLSALLGIIIYGLIPS